jgi:hypothetical protein
MRRLLAAKAVVVGLMAATQAAAEIRPGDHVAFVACPIAQDVGPEEDLCFFAENRGERFALRTQIIEDLGPLLRHKVLVEGTVQDGPRACGGWRLEGMTSSLTELSMECNEVRPQMGEGRAPSPQALAAQADLDARLRANPELSVQSTPSRIPVFAGPPPKGWEMPYNFDSDRGNGPSLQILVALVQQARRDNAGKIRVHAWRGASRLENGEIMEEPHGLAERRAKKIAGVIAGLGYPAERIETRWTERPDRPNGKTDWTMRRVRVEVAS